MLQVDFSAGGHWGLERFSIHEVPRNTTEIVLDPSFGLRAAWTYFTGHLRYIRRFANIHSRKAVRAGFRLRASRDPIAPAARQTYLRFCRMMIRVLPYYKAYLFRDICAGKAD